MNCSYHLVLYFKLSSSKYFLCSTLKMPSYFLIRCKYMEIICFLSFSISFYRKGNSWIIVSGKDCRARQEMEAFVSHFEYKLYYQVIVLLEFIIFVHFKEKT